VVIPNNSIFLSDSLEGNILAHYETHEGYGGVWLVIIEKGLVPRSGGVGMGRGNREKSDFFVNIMFFSIFKGG